MIYTVLLYYWNYYNKYCYNLLNFYNSFNMFVFLLLRGTTQSSTIKFFSRGRHRSSRSVLLIKHGFKPDALPDTHLSGLGDTLNTLEEYLSD